MLRIEIPGNPAPWTVYTKRGEPSIGFQNMRAWQEQIKSHVRQAWGDREPLTGPVSLTVSFYREWPQSAPQSHSGAIQRWAVKHILTKPDVTNYLKAFEDALKGIVFVDDSQTVGIVASKLYSGGPGFTVLEIEQWQ